MVGMIPGLGDDLILGTDYANFTPLLAKACQENVTYTWWGEAPYGRAEVEERPLRLKLSIKQKREQRREYHATTAPGLLEPAPQAATVLTTIGSFRQAQREDPTLKNAWQQALNPDERSARPRRRHGLHCLTLLPPTRNERVWRPIPFGFRGQQGSGRRFARLRDYNRGGSRQLEEGERKEQEGREETTDDSYNARRTSRNQATLRSCRIAAQRDPQL
ncbi:hypothetical protein NDU88_005680 [Pleurodeles waltl]|uniref:Uncharacterized protein n=1 Tax=Pleurodeles waltl TaxID=8319 RepID=A0AAV7X1Y0_PLEWA|nr:hypothetical protein NDU88_005680 [Pleurodeles waltl]